MRSSLLLSLVLLTAAPVLHAQPNVAVSSGLPEAELVLMLPHVFFDAGSAELPTRYHRLDAPRSFDETSIEGDHRAHYYHLLNIIGARLRAHPTATIAIAGACSMQPELGETVALADARAAAVRDYLARVWGIDPLRMPLASSSGLPPGRSASRVEKGHQENRRVDILSDDLRIVGPTSIGPADAPILTCRFFGYAFDSAELPPHCRPLLDTLLSRLDRADVWLVGTSDTNHVPLRAWNLWNERADRLRKLVATQTNSDRVIDCGTSSDTPDAAVPLPEDRLMWRGVTFHAHERSQP